MGELDGATLGIRVREARERAGLKQGELANEIGLDRTAINKIENGTRKVTALELADIGRALGIRMTSLLVEPSPALVSHRSSNGLEVVDSSIDRALADLAAEVELVQLLAPKELGLDRIDELADELPLARPSSVSDAEDLAPRARALLGADRDSPMRDLVGLVSAIGLLPFAVDFGPDTADAGTILLRKGAVTVVNSHNRVGRRRLALAHELGHYLVADEYTIDWNVTADGPGTDVESLLDRFARALLLPAHAVLERWARLRENHELRDAAVQLGSEYRVDMATLARRLQELEALDSGDASAVRMVRTTKTDILEFDLLVPTDLEGLSVAVPYQRGVLRALRDERISRERALDLLRGAFTDDDLPAPRGRREDELWSFVS